MKVCCIGSVAEGEAAIAAGADALGFVPHMPDGTGMLADAAVAALIPTVPPPVCAILLTGEVTARAIAAHLDRTGASAVQVVTPIDPRELAQLAALRPHVRRIQAVHVEGPEARALVAGYAPHVHAILLDSGKPSAAVPSYGGTGEVHDWEVSAAIVRTCDRPVFLAGGLHAGNVEEAIRRVRPFGLDLCSGLRSDGALDPDKLDAFMEAVRDADRR